MGKWNIRKAKWFSMASQAVGGRGEIWTQLGFDGTPFIESETLKEWAWAITQWKDSSSFSNSYDGIPQNGPGTLALP